MEIHGRSCLQCFHRNCFLFGAAIEIRTPLTLFTSYIHIILPSYLLSFIRLVSLTGLCFVASPCSRLRSDDSLAINTDLDETVQRNSWYTLKSVVESLPKYRCLSSRFEGGCSLFFSGFKDN